MGACDSAGAEEAGWFGSDRALEDAFASEGAALAADEPALAA